MRKCALKSLMLVPLSLYVTACSKQASTSPTAPTAAVSASGDSTISPASHGGGSGSGGSGSGGSGSGNSGGGSGNSGGSGSGHGGGPGSGHDDTRVELNGIAESVTGECPTLQLTVAGRLVTTAASTEFKHAPCSALAAGQQLEVRGTMQPGGAVLAARIESEEREDDDEDADDDEIVGEIASVAGVCPALTLTVGTVTITATAGTTFDDVECGDLATGMTIEAKGVRQSEVSLLASRIERKAPGLEAARRHRR